MNVEMTAILIVVSVVTGLARNGLINDEALSQEEANVIFDALANDVASILSE